MSEYIATPLPQKLGIKPGFTVSIVDAPEGFMETLGAEITHARLVRGIEDNADIIHVFIKSKADLESSFPHLKQALGKPHALWVSWPKRGSGVETDVTEDVIREIGLHHGLVDVKVCSIDTTWSGLKFVYRLKDR